MKNGLSFQVLLQTGLTAGFGLLLAAQIMAAETQKRPNVLIITTDQQRVDATSASGNKWVKTPNMDGIAARGVSFTRSYTSYPLCSPARSSLHTGRPPHEIRVDRNTVPIDPTIPISGQVFHAAGYETGYSGKWHLPQSYPTDGIAGYEVLNKTTRNNKLAVEVDEATMTAAVEFLRRRHEKPFLLVASFINPHDICLPAGEDSSLLPDLWKKYQPPAGAELPPLPANFSSSSGAPQRVRRLHADWSENQWRKYRYAYFRMMEDVDRQVGGVLAALRQSGKEDDTLIIFTSDHGEGLGAHQWTGKMMFYDDEAAVPLIVSWKGVTPAGRMDREHLVSTLDVLPTICEYAGIKPPPFMRGESLRTVIDHPDRAGHEFVVSEMAGAPAAGGRSFMVRTQHYKYMTFPAGDGQGGELLFNLDSDPGEMKNLAGEATLAAELNRHRQLLIDWKKFTEEDKHPIRPAATGSRTKAKRKQ